jgi:transposase
MGSRVELFEKIRRDREFDGLSSRALARRYGVHRRTVRQALESAVPPERKRPVGRPAPALGPWREWIDQILIADQSAPPKQRHTAKRIADRLADEHGVVVAGSTMRDHVRKRRRELGLAAEAFCEQVHDPGVTAEVDWGEATVSLAGVLTVFGLFLRPENFRRALERELILEGNTNYGRPFAEVVGGAACAAHADRCDLSRGVVVDDAANTVTFHFVAPDPEFLDRLTLPDAYAVPAGTPYRDIGLHPMPSTGAYGSASHATAERWSAIVTSMSGHTRRGPTATRTGSYFNGSPATRPGSRRSSAAAPTTSSTECRRTA